MGSLIWFFHFLLYFLQYQVASSSSSSFSLSSFSSSTHPLCRHDQRSALLQFKHMFTINNSSSSDSFFDRNYYGIPSYPKTLNWNENNATDCCNWDGVTCDKSTGHVIGLDLGCSQLYGTIHPNSSLFQLSHLQRLNLAYNDFNHSPIPYAIGKLASLTHLNLSCSSYSGSIPSEISHLSKLISLDLSTCLWSLPFDVRRLRLEPDPLRMLLKNLTRLQVLFLSRVDISSVVPDSLANMSSLIALRLSRTGLQGNLPDDIFHLPNLKSLFLGDNNDVNVNLPKVAWRSGNSLRELSLSNTKLSGELPDSIGSLTNISSLITLGLSGTGLRGKLPDGIFHLPNLQTLYLRHNIDMNVDLPKVSWGRSLQCLDLSYTKLSGELPDSIGYLKSLTSLSLSGTGLRGKLPDGIFHLPNLQRLYLRDNIDMNVDLPKVSWGRSLQCLDLSYTKLSGELPDSIGYLKSLTYLSLSYCKLEGSILNSLGNLTQITSLDLSGNNLEGKLPDVFAELTMLEDLYLESNHFIGGFPSSIANLTKLVDLSLHDNQITGPIPSNLSGLHNLGRLYLGHNSLSGTIPSSLFNHPSLVVIDLSYNLITGQIPAFHHDSPLTEIYLSGNKLDGSIQLSNSTLANLKILYLGSNNLSGVVQLQKLKNITNLGLSNTNLSVVTSSHSNITLPNLMQFEMSSCKIEEFPDFLRTSENLAVLDLSNNRIHGQVPDWTWFMWKTSLEYLNLSYNFLTHIKELPWENLRSFDLHSNLLQGPLPVPPLSIVYIFISNNSLSGEIPLLICNASSLEILDLSQNKLSGEIPQCLGNSSNALSVLDLHLNRFQGSIRLIFAEHNNLRNLDLNGNQLEGPLPRSLISCRSLEVLDVGNNNMNDTFPYWLGTLPEFQVLVLHSNKFHGLIDNPTGKSPFPKLRIIDISCNEFNGHLPVSYFKYFNAMKNSTMANKKYMGDNNSYYHDSVTITIKGVGIELERIFTVLTTIDFSSNNFSGEIPNVIGRLDSLKLLNLSHNSLSGRIPESLGDLENLESLDLSSNKLLGEIPSLLTKLTFLEVLNLSWNNLHGPIPRGPQFNTFGTSSYVGNSGLCRFPLPKECDDNHTQVQPPPMLPPQEDDSDFDGFTWKIVMIGYGCGLPAGLFLGFLMFLFGRPKFIVRYFDKKWLEKVIRLGRTGRRN